MKVLVCGGRDFDDLSAVCDALNGLHHEHTVRCVVEGGASGADRLARWWAESVGCEVATYTAYWREGRQAGPKRNTRMLKESKPDLVLAFPGGRGTADMVRKARAAGIPVQVIE